MNCNPSVAARLAILSVVMLAPLSAHAQKATFSQAVADLATIAAADGRSPELGAIVDRLAAALVVWDDRLAALAAAVDTEHRTATVARRIELHVGLGREYLDRGRVHDATRELSAAHALDPLRRDVAVLRALTLAAAGPGDAADDALLGAWRLDPENPITAYYLLLHSVGLSPSQLAAARGTLTAGYERLRQGPPPAVTSPPFTMLGIIADGFTERPIVGDASTAAGFALLRDGRYTEAVAALRQGIAAGGSNSPRAHYERAQAAEASALVADARRAYEQALTGALTGRAVLWLGVGRLALVEGDVPGAIAAFTSAIRLDPNNPYLHRELAAAYAAEGRADEAFREFVAALLVNPRDADTVAAIGQLFLDTHRPADAIRAFTRALELMPSRFETHYALGTAFARLGDTAAANREFSAFDRAQNQVVQRRRRGIERQVQQDEAIRSQQDAR